MEFSIIYKEVRFTTVSTISFALNVVIFLSAAAPFVLNQRYELPSWLLCAELFRLVASVEGVGCSFSCAQVTVSANAFASSTVILPRDGYASLRPCAFLSLCMCGRQTNSKTRRKTIERNSAKRGVANILFFCARCQSNHPLSGTTTTKWT